MTNPFADADGFPRVPRILLATLLAWLILCILVLWVVPEDSTDISSFNRSSLRLHVDAKTGCHYLSTLLGGPTPRLDAEGQHICTGPEE